MESKKLKIYSFFIIELILALIFLYILGNIVQIDFSAKKLSYVGTQADITCLAVILALFLIIFFTIKKKKHYLYNVQTDAYNAVKEAGKNKVMDAKQDPKLIALLAIELLFAVVFAVAIAAYLDPDWSIIHWETVGIYPPITTLLNGVIFVIILGLFLYLYSLTKPYREMRKEMKNKK